MGTPQKNVPQSKMMLFVRKWLHFNDFAIQIEAWGLFGVG